MFVSKFCQHSLSSKLSDEMSAAEKVHEISAKENRPGGSRTVARGIGSAPGKVSVQDGLQFQAESMGQLLQMVMQECREERRAASE